MTGGLAVDDLGRHWLCTLANRLQQLAWTDLTEAQASRGQFQVSEEAVTTLLVRAMYRLGQRSNRPTVYVREYGRSEEGLAGADLEVWLVSAKTGSGRGFLIQAKRLYAPTQAHPPLYERVNHIVGGSGARQVDLLIAAAGATRGLEPVYWLYDFDVTVLGPCAHCGHPPTPHCHPPTALGQEIGVRSIGARAIRSLLDGGVGRFPYSAMLPAGAHALHWYWCGPPVRRPSTPKPGGVTPDAGGPAALPPAVEGAVAELPAYVALALTADDVPDRTTRQRSSAPAPRSSAASLVVVRL